MNTYHSIVRANERTRYSGRSAERFVELGVTRGKTSKDFTQAESRFLAEHSRRGCTAKAYNGYMLIVNEYGECVTLFELPKWFGRKRYYDCKTQIRHAKRYCGDRFLREAAES